MSALLGANIIKVKLPSDFLEEDPTKAAFENNIAIGTLQERVAHIKKLHSKESASCILWR